MVGIPGSGRTTKRLAFWSVHWIRPSRPENVDRWANEADANTTELARCYVRDVRLRNFRTWGYRTNRNDDEEKSRPRWETGSPKYIQLDDDRRKIRRNGVENGKVMSEHGGA